MQGSFSLGALETMHAKVQCRGCLSAKRLLPSTHLTPAFWGSGRFTNRHEGLRGRAGPGHSHSIDRIDSHLIGYTLDHAPGFVAQLPQQIEVEPHPPVALFLLALQDVS